MDAVHQLSMHELLQTIERSIDLGPDARGLMGRKHSSKSSPAIFALLKSFIGLMFCQVAGMVNGKWALMDNT